MGLAFWECAQKLLSRIHYRMRSLLSLRQAEKSSYQLDKPKRMKFLYKFFKQ